MDVKQEDFLKEREFMEDRLSKGIDVMPSDAELLEFQAIAKTIDPERYFTVHGCQECVNALVRFVFKNRGTFTKNETFPKAEKVKQKSIYDKK